MFNRIPAYVYHLVIWATYVAVPFLFNMERQLEEHSLGVLVYKYLAFYGINVLLFYFHYSYTVPRLLENKRIKIYLLLSIVSLMAFAFLHYGLYWVNSNFILDREEIKALSLFYFLSYITQGFFYVIAAMVIRYAVDHWKDRQKARELEKEKTQAELNFLKAQVNPHFLFNAFNSLYALSLKSDKRLPNAILKLSDLMRYMLDYSQKDEVPLAEEIQMIEDYLEVQSIRLDEQFDLQFHKFREASDTKVIIPLILLPVVENCFKHGDLSNEGFIHLTLKFDEKRMVFTARNKIEEGKSSNGTGLKNLEKRLALKYNHDYELKTLLEDGICETHLEIPVYEH